MSCLDMCKFVAWLDIQDYYINEEIFHKLQLWAHKPFVKKIPGSMSGRGHLVETMFACSLAQEDILIGGRIYCQYGLSLPAVWMW